MSTTRTALIVSCLPHQLAQLERWVSGDGYAPVVAADFRDARRSLESSPPDLLVTDLKLGAYNGLHLVIWARGRALKTKTIVLGEADPVLQREAEREGATYLTPPFDAQTLLAAVATLFASYHPARRSQRKRVSLDATVEGVLASVVDVSYEGLRLEVPNADGFTLPPFLTVNVPAFEMAWRVRRVWLGRAAEQANGALVCGAALPSDDNDSMAEWRRIVDAVPGFEDVEAHSASR